MMHHIRPWRIFQYLGDDNEVSLKIPPMRGTESLTVMAIDTLLLIAVARIIQAKSIFEIGTGLGYTSLHLARNTAAEIVTVDNRRLECVFDGTEWESRIIQVIGDIANAERMQADMVFCDINPDLDCCRISTRLAFDCTPKVIAWHDYRNAVYPAQTENLDQLAETHEIYHVEDTGMCFWFADGRLL